MLQGELGDHSAEDRRGRLAEALRASLGTGSSAERLRVLDEVEAWVAPGDAETDLDRVVPSHGELNRRREPNGVRRPSDAIRPNGADEAVFDPDRLDPASAARVVLDRFSELPPKLLDELRARVSPGRPVTTAERPATPSTTDSPPPLEAVRRELRLSKDSRIDPARLDRLVAALYPEVRRLIHALCNVLNPSWEDTADQTGWPRLPRVDETERDFRGYVAGTGDDEPARLGVLRAVIAARCLIDNIKPGLLKLPPGLDRLEPARILKGVDEAQKGRSGSLGAIFMGTSLTTEHRCWLEYTELAQKELQNDALERAYVAQFVEGAAQSFSHALPQS